VPTVAQLRTRIAQATLPVRPWSFDAIAMRNGKQAEMVRPYLRPGDTVVDVGCGTGHLAGCVQDRFGVEVTGLDVMDFREDTSIAYREFDGTTIPLPDRSVDHVIVSFTLHHNPVPMRLARECRRVARRTLLVFEDMPTGRIGRAMVALHVEAYRRQFKLAERGGDYRAALAWLADEATQVTRTPMPTELLDHLYVPRCLLAHQLAD
jgi:ubiquinone/menaquinone biosynthesis C-methylase UbiE